MYTCMQCQARQEMPRHWVFSLAYIVCSTTELYVASQVAKWDKVQRACSSQAPKASTTSGTHPHPKSSHLGVLL